MTDAQRIGKNTAAELPCDIVYASSTDHAPIYPSAVDLMLMQAAPGDLPLRWMSSKSCSYPQEIGLFLSTRAYVKSIRIVSHLLFAPSKVEVLAADDARVQRHVEQTSASCGAQLAMQVYCSTECHALCSMNWRCDGSNARSSDIRMDVHEPLNVVKLVLHGPRVVGSNLYHQVALFQVQILGVSLPSSPHEAPSIPALDGGDRSTNAEVHQALLDSGVPLELVADVLDATDVDAYTAKAIEHAAAVKATCIAREDYDKAKLLTARIAALESVGKQFQALVALKVQAIATEEYDQAQAYHNQLELLATSREKLMGATFDVCHASQTAKTSANPAASLNHGEEPTTLPPCALTIHDFAMRRWLREEKMNGCASPSAKTTGRTTNAFLEKMWGREFMACATSSAWNVRRACVEIAEQHVAILIHVFDVETLYDMYVELVRATLLADRTIPTLVAVLHLVRTIFEKPTAQHTPSVGSTDSLGFGSAGLRRGVLRPGIQLVIDAIFRCSVHFNTLLREDCVRTVRFLAQQPHVADLAMEATWARTKQVTERSFELIVGLKFVQDQLETVLGLAMEASTCASAPRPSQSTAKMFDDMAAFMNATAIDVSSDDAVRAAALDCLALVHACQQQDYRGVATIAREVHVPLFRAFPFSDAENDRLVHQAQAHANQHQLPVQLMTYALDTPALDGFDQFHELKKGTVAFAGHVSPRQDQNVETTDALVAPQNGLPSSVKEFVGEQLPSTPSPSPRPKPTAHTLPTAHSPRQPSVPLVTIPTTTDSDSTQPYPGGARKPPKPTDDVSPHTARTAKSQVVLSPSAPPSNPLNTPLASTPSATAPPVNGPLRSAPKAEAVQPTPDAPLPSAESQASPSPDAVVEKAVSPTKAPSAASRKNQVSPAAAELPPSPTTSAPGAPPVAVTPTTARHSIETMQAVAEVAKKVSHADEKKSGCSIS